jgi:hypothetical protein
LLPSTLFLSGKETKGEEQEPFQKPLLDRILLDRWAEAEEKEFMTFTLTIPALPENSGDCVISLGIPCRA